MPPSWRVNAPTVVLVLCRLSLDRFWCFLAVYHLRRTCFPHNMTERWSLAVSVSVASRVIVFFTKLSVTKRSRDDVSFLIQRSSSTCKYGFTRSLLICTSWDLNLLTWTSEVMFSPTAMTSHVKDKNIESFLTWFLAIDQDNLV